MRISHAELNSIGRRRTGKVAPRKEGEIQKAILDYLTLCHGVTVWRTNSGSLNVPATGKAKARYVRFNTMPGLPDICGFRFWNGRATPLFVEVKRPNGKLTQQQAVFLAWVRSQGCITIVATCVEDVANELKKEQT